MDENNQDSLSAALDQANAWMQKPAVVSTMLLGGGVVAEAWAQNQLTAAAAELDGCGVLGLMGGSVSAAAGLVLLGCGALKPFVKPPEKSKNKDTSIPDEMAEGSVLGLGALSAIAGGVGMVLVKEAWEAQNTEQPIAAEMAYHSGGMGIVLAAVFFCQSMQKVLNAANVKP